MTKFDNKGNQFFIELIPDVDDEGAWLGRYHLAINVRRTTLDDDSFYALENVCQMACAALSLMEEDIGLRERVFNFLKTPDEQNTSNKQSIKVAVDNTDKNVINVNFNNEEKNKWVHQ